MILKDEPDLLETLQEKIGLPVLLIHVIRNPFDTITTMLRRTLEEKGQGKEIMDASQLGPLITAFFDRVEVNNTLRKDPQYKVLDVYHEDFIRDPKGELSRIISFLGLEADERYLEQCATIVFDKPHQSRHAINWTEEWIAEVEKKIAQYDFLKRYSYFS